MEVVGLRRRLRGERLLFITNWLGAEGPFAVGNAIDYDGDRWKITRHHTVMPRNAPWASVYVYGRPA